MIFPPNSIVLAQRGSDAAFIHDKTLRLVVGGVGSIDVSIPLQHVDDDTLTVLERLRTLIDAAGDAMSRDMVTG